jgi:two-component system, sporulation sensor kinase D
MKHETAPDYRRLMTRMVDVISHDIRNPLNNILLSTAQFKLEALPDKEDTAFYIDIIERSCDKVNSLLEEIIAIIHQPGLNPDTFDITELMKELVNENEERLALKDIKVNTSLNEVVVARFDRAMMKQALFNVIDNAVDASGKDQVISLKVFEEGGDVKLIIADKGKGIPKDIQSHIFAPFYTTKERHKGLGLALTRNVIEAHQGSISLHSSEAGTEVTITIPKNA